MKRTRTTIAIFSLSALIVLAVLTTNALSYRNSPTRTVKVKVVVDTEFASLPQWQDRVRGYFEAASGGLLELINVKLDITEYSVWRHGRIMDFGAMTAAMINEVDKGRAEILIGLTLVQGSGKSKEIRKDGLTIARKGIMVKVYRGDEDQNKSLPNVIVHEMVHIFGGVHVYDGSIMAPVFDEKTELRLDALNEDIVGITRNIDFAQGYASLPRHELERLMRLYRRATHLGNTEMPTLLELGEICAELELYDDAINAYRQVVRQDQSAAYAWGEMGDCYRKAGEIEKAAETFERAVNHVDEKGIFYGKLAVLYFNYGQYRLSYDRAMSARRHGYEVDGELWRHLKDMGIP